MQVDDKNVPALVGFEEEGPFDFVVPEKNLLRAVLMSALNDLKQSGDLQRKATEFFLSRDEDYIFSFRSICDFLSVDPTKVLRVAGIPYGQRPSAPTSEEKAT
jgi:hypothetical protein